MNNFVWVYRLPTPAVVIGISTVQWNETIIIKRYFLQSGRFSSCGINLLRRYFLKIKPTQRHLYWQGRAKNGVLVRPLLVVACIAPTRIFKLYMNYYILYDIVMILISICNIFIISVCCWASPRLAVVTSSAHCIAVIVAENNPR